MEILPNDIVHYREKTTMYLVLTHDRLQNIKTTAIYPINNKKNLVRVNKYRIDQKFNTKAKELIDIINIYPEGDALVYIIRNSSGIRKVDEAYLDNINQILNNNENRLQEQKNPQLRGDGSGSGQLLRRRNKICYRSGYRGQQHCPSEGKSRIGRNIENLSLGRPSLLESQG